MSSRIGLVQESDRSLSFTFCSFLDHCRCLKQLLSSSHCWLIKLFLVFIERSQKACRCHPCSTRQPIHRPPNPRFSRCAPTNSLELRFGTNIRSFNCCFVSPEFAAPGSGTEKAVRVFFIVYCQKNASCQWIILLISRRKERKRKRLKRAAVPGKSRIVVRDAL